MSNYVSLLISLLQSCQIPYEYHSILRVAIKICRDDMPKNYDEMMWGEQMKFLKTKLPLHCKDYPIISYEEIFDIEIVGDEP